MLEARDVSVGYISNAPLISGFSALFEAGTITAITGPSGCGKSTLLYTIGLMLSSMAGSVLIRGTDVSDVSDSGRARLRAVEYGFVFQDAVLDPTRSVISNVVETSLYRGSSRRVDVERGLQLLAEFGVELRADAKPGQVSGGQAQRIALCRALLHQPPIILADEPTGNLDSVSARIVLEAFRSRADAGSAVVIVTHDDKIARACDGVIEL